MLWIQGIEYSENKRDVCENRRYFAGRLQGGYCMVYSGLWRLLGIDPCIWLLLFTGYNQGLISACIAWYNVELIVQNIAGRLQKNS